MALVLLCAAAVRADDDIARKAAEALKHLPEGMTHQHLMMPLRDGVKLATEVFKPAGDGPWPVVLMRTPYSRWDTKSRFTEMKGIACVIVTQNVRGRYGSEGAGTFPKESFDNEINDSYDCIEWIAKQPWCNGRVGMIGVSGHGMAASNALWSNAPHLVAVHPRISAGNAYLYWIYSNGARRYEYVWLGQRGVKVTSWPRPTTSPFDLKKRRSFVAKRAAKAKIAFETGTGWYDLFSEAALDNFQALAHTGKCHVTLGPTGHGGIGGELKYPRRRRPAGLKVRSFRQWMTEPEPAEPTKSTLVYYLMGDTMDPEAPGNVWKTTHTWPVEHTPTSFYLGKDGTLTRTAPTARKASLTYTHDPRNPVPTHGGNYSTGTKNGPHDQRPLAGRKDVLRFVTEPLAEAVGITGKVRLELHISSDAPDTMFVATLVDIYPNGYEALVRQSAMLARYWQGLDKPAPLKKGKVVTLDMDMWSTALVFNKGHRIALLVAGSSEKSYEVHPNTYQPVASMDKAVVAHNRVHVSARHASRLILPVIAKESFAK